jgi:hypothetical protein
MRIETESRRQQQPGYAAQGHSNAAWKKVQRAEAVSGRAFLHAHVSLAPMRAWDGSSNASSITAEKHALMRPSKQYKP